MVINRLIRRGQRPKIFISYRRDDAKKKADQLHENLERHFGDNSTFMDVEAIEGGHRYRKVIQSALDVCEVFLAIIGPNWLTIRDENNVRRLDKKDDWVRFEIEAALKRDDILVIPVLVQNATLPRPDELPKSLGSLTDEIQAQKIDDDHWDSDVTKLIKIIEGNIGRRDSRRSGVKWLIAASAVVALGLAGLIWNVVPERTESAPASANVTTGVAAASPTAAGAVTPVANTGGRDNGNQNSTNSTITNTQSDTAATPPPTPTATPDLLNTFWNYKRGNVSYVIELKANGEFYYWRTKNNDIDRSVRFDGRWKLIGIDEIELIFTPTSSAGKEVHTGKLGPKQDSV